MAEKTENKAILERTYVVPIKRGLRHTPDYKKARKAVKIVLQFMAKHMRVENRDVKLIKMDKLVNHELWRRGIANPPNKIKLKAKKDSEGIVTVELFEIPKILHFKMDKEKRSRGPSVKTKKQPEEKTEQTAEEKKVVEEKKASTVEAGLQRQAQEAKSQKHQVGGSPMKRQTPVQRNIPKSK